MSDQYPPPPSQPYPGGPVPPQYLPTPGTATPPPAPAPRRAAKFLLGVLAGVILLVVGFAGGYFVGIDRSKPAVAPPAKEEGTERLMRVSFKPGGQDTYKMEMSITGMTSGLGPVGPGGSNTALMDLTMSGNLQIQMVGQLPDGSTRVRISYSNFKVAGTVAGQAISPDSPLALEAIQPVTMTIAPNGTYKTESNVMGTSGAPTASGFGLWSPIPMLPDRQVEEGDTWSRKLKVPLAVAGSGEVTIETESVMVGWEETRFGKSARIRTTYTTPLTGQDLGLAAGTDLTIRGSTKATVTYLFSATENKLVSAHIDPLTVNLEMTSATTGQTYRTDMTTRGTIERTS